MNDGTIAEVRDPAPERRSLREALGARPDPEFELTLPRGWGAVTVDESGRSLLERRLQERMMQAGRPDLHVQLRSMLRDSFRTMESQGALVTYMALDPEGEGQFGATSMTAIMRRSTPDAPLDEYVQYAIRELGAHPLMGDLRTMRFVSEVRRDLGDEEAIATSVHYLTPVPGSRRQRALELQATFGRPASVPADHPTVVNLLAMFDACASTLRWTRPEAAR